MSRKILTKKRFPESDLKYNSFLVSLLINRILKKGKKFLAKKIVYDVFDSINLRTNKNPLFILEKAVINSSPKVQLKTVRIGGVTYQLPTIVNKFRSTNISIKWLVSSARKRSGKGMLLKLTNELLDASKGLGNAVKKKDETHKMAEANRSLSSTFLEKNIIKK